MLYWKASPSPLTNSPQLALEDISDLLMIQVPRCDGSPRRCVDYAASSQRQSLPDTVKIKSTLAILSSADTLIKKYLFNHSKFIAGKSRPGQVETDFSEVSLDGHQIWSAASSRPLIPRRNKSLYWIYKGSRAHAYSAHEHRLYTHQHTPSVCNGGCQNM